MKHDHAAAIDRIGRGTIQSHFNISRQAVDYWTREGVPRMHLNSLRMLALVRGVAVPELSA